MKYFYFNLFLIVSMNISAQGLYTDEDGNKQQWGNISVKDLTQAPFNVWYNESQLNYTPRINTKLAKRIKESKDLQILVYMGTWCSDSHEWVPKFVKLWQTMGLTMDNVRIIGVHNAEDKRKHAPDGSHEKYNIEYVPTFIFLECGKEIGRIIEYPPSELEDDITNIILGKS